jgi:CBS domain-containing protein
MKVKDIMSKNVKCCKRRDTLAEVVSAMWENNCGIIPMVDKEGRVAGVITDRDIALALWRKDRAPSEVLAGELPTAKLHTCADTDDIDDALRIMQHARVRRVPVINADEKIVGILSMNDVALHAHRAGARTPSITFDKVVDTLRAICKHPETEKPAAKRATVTP